MKIKQITFIPIFLILWMSFYFCTAQGIAVGKWRDHLPYHHGIKVVTGKYKVYCITTSGMFSFNKSDNSIEKMSKVTGLSDFGISAAAYSKTQDMLIIGYSNGNVDIVQGNDIINIADIKSKEMIGSKNINNILAISDFAYLSCGFGVIVIDLKRLEIKDTYLIGPNGGQLNINDVTYDGTYLYAATDIGIYKGKQDNPSLVNYAEWDCITDIDLGQPFSWIKNKSFTSVASYNNKLYALYNSGSWEKDLVLSCNGSQWDTTMGCPSNLLSLRKSGNYLMVVSLWDVAAYDEAENKKYGYWFYGFNPKWAEYDDSNVLWVADYYGGLIKMVNEVSKEYIFPKGPDKSDVAAISILDNKVWTAAGAIGSSWNNSYHFGEVNYFTDENWKSLNNATTPALDPVRDLVTIAINPLNTSQVFAGSIGSGIIEFRDYDFYKIHNESNSTLQNIPNFPGVIRIFGITFDKMGNLWVANSGNVTGPFSVLTSDGHWYSMPYGSMVGVNEIGNIIVTKNNHKWAVLPRGVGLFAFDEKGTYENSGDDNIKKFSVLDENGKLISNDIHSIAEDLNGAVWVGTNKGVVAYYNPENVFSTSGFYAQQIKIPSEIAGQANYLLESDIITAIAIDGSGKKWFGTENSGVYLMSEDCSQQLFHFTTENSPLLSNNITCIGVNGVTGEVFFGTDKGLVSYRNSATDGAEDFEDVLVFPNPVKPGYTGYITVMGLVTSSNVKFTDITGNIVYETKAEGGMAVWNGNDFHGDRVKSGVYLIFSTNEDGSKTNVSKVLLIN